LQTESGNLSGSEEGKVEAGGIQGLLMTCRHFFGDILGGFQSSIADPRFQPLIIYPLSCLMFTGILMFLFRLGARRQVHWLLHSRQAVDKYRQLFGVQTLPHGDTLNHLYSKLDPEQVGEVVSSLTETLIRKKILYPYRLLDKYFVVVLDATGMLTFDQRHCQHCLKSKSGSREIFYHQVLEAKIVTRNGFVFSLMSEFIENSDSNVSKQDSELKAFYRLAPRLKKRFPRLPICLVGDALYAGGPVFSICNQFGWKFLITFKQTDMPAVNEEFERLSKLQAENKATFQTGKTLQVTQKFRWVSHILHTDDSNTDHLLNALECLEEKPGRTTKFRWITNFSISAKNFLEIANNGGRFRWKIENEGFNVQKNGGFGLEHAYSKSTVSLKVFYYLLQIAHLWAQLLEKGSLLKQFFPKGLGSSKNLAARLKEEWIYKTLPPNFWATTAQASFQIRFNSS
jgi:hypothetical protein